MVESVGFKLLLDGYEAGFHTKHFRYHRMETANSVHVLFCIFILCSSVGQV